MLNSQNIPITFVGGVDSKSDPKQVIPSKLIALQNGVFTRPGQISKRFGYAPLNSSILGGGSISAGAGIASFNGELLLFSGGNVYTYSPNLSAWISKGVATSVNVTTQPVTRNTYAQTAQDSAVISTLQCFAWEDSRGGVRYSILDTGTGAQIVQDQQLAAGVIMPKVLAFSSAFVILVANATTGAIGYYYISAATPTSVSAFQSLGSDLNSTPAYDASLLGAKLAVAYATSGTSLKLLTIAALGGSATSTTISSETSAGPLALIPDTANTRVSIAYYNGTAVKIQVRNSTTLASVSSATLETLANVTSVAGLVTGSTTGAIYYTVSAASTFNYLVRQVTLTSYTAGSPGVFNRAVALAGKPFLYNATVYVPTVFSSLLQPTYFVLDGAGNVVAKLAAGVAGGLPTRPILPESLNTATGVYSLPVMVVDLLTTDTTDTVQSVTTPTYSLTGVNAVSLNFADGVNGFQSAMLASNLHTSGGFLFMYDGAQPVEHGFHLYPEGGQSSVIPFGGSLSPPSGVTTAGFQTQATYEWTDNQGQIHISAPSVANTAALGPVLPGSPIAPFGFVSLASGGVVLGTPAQGTLLSISSLFSVTGTTTNSSSTVAITPLAAGTQGDVCLDYLYPGIAVSGAGIPANTTIATVTTTGITLSANATASATITLTFTFQYQPALTFSSGNQTAVTTNVQNLLLGGRFGFASTQVAVSSTDNLAVGMNVSDNFARMSSAITAIDTVNKIITVSPAYLGNTAGYAMLQANYPFTATTTSGSAVITGCSAAAVAYAQQHAGCKIVGTGLAAGQFILSATGTTITLNANATATSTSSRFIYFYGTENLRVGNVLTGAGLQTGTTISFLNQGAVTLSLPPTANSSGTYTINNTFGIVQSVPTLRVTAKKNARSPVSIVTYRTPGNGSVFQRSSSVVSPNYNDPTVDSVTFVDTVTDLNLLAAPQIYTTGGVLENEPPNACSMPTAHKGRLWVLDTTNPLQLFFSQQVVPGVPVQFSPFLTQAVDPAGGNTTGLGSMDDKLVIFKKTAIFWLGGQGPDSTGSNSDFGNGPILIPTDNGCINARSIVLTPMGLMFQSLKGIYLLGRDLSVQYVGRDVEAYNGQTITSAKLIQTLTQVRFTLGNGTALVFDYAAGQWSVFSNHAAMDSTIYGTNFAYLQAGGAVMVETPGAFTDNGAFVSLSLTTAWIQTAGIQGYQRARRALVLGDYESAHNLVMSVAYDFNPTLSQTDTVAVTTAPPGAEQYRMHLAQQKCEAIQFTLSDTQNGTAGESVRFSGITLECGVKKGPFRLPAANSVG